MPATKAAARAAERPRLSARSPDSDQIAAGLFDLAAAIREGTETLRPAAETVQGFGGRLDSLCFRITGKWQWILCLILYSLQQAAPEVYEAVKDVVGHLSPPS